MNPLIEALGKEKRWVNWQPVTKVPLSIDGRNARPNDPSTWSTYDEVRKVSENVGIMFTSDQKLLGIDIDHCLQDGEIVHEKREQILAILREANTYTEISPSGTGLHVLLLLTKALKLISNRKGSFEAYTILRYFTVTSIHFGAEKALRTVTPEEAVRLLSILGYPWGKKESVALAVVDDNAKDNPSSLDDDAILEKMFAAKNGAKVKSLYNGDISAYNGDDSVADLALCSHLVFWTGKDASQIERIWLASPLGEREKTQKRKDYRDRTIATAIANCNEVYNPSVDPEEIDNKNLMDELDNEKKSQTLELVEFVLQNKDIELFRDQHDTAFVRVPINDRKETLHCGSRRFFLWLSESFHEASGIVPQPSAAKAATQIIEGKAVFKRKEYKLSNRVARLENELWYDLADKQNRAVLITPDGWRIVSEPPILFYRHKHQLEQVEPESGGSISDLLQFVNITEKSQQLLLLVYLVSCFIPGFPHPLLYIYGEQGSAKSTLAKLLRKLGDPSRIEVLNMPSDTGELALQLSRHHMAFYENVSSISNRISDTLCIAVTGGGISKRELYTDADDFIFNLQTIIGINGINISAIQPDLLERCILLELKRMEGEKRLTEQDLYARFEQARPGILGAIFGAVVKALRIKPGIRLAEKTRMADFLEWGCAISEALGYGQQEFLDAYYQKVQEQSEEALMASTEAQLLILLMEDRDRWFGTPQELLSALGRVVTENGELQAGKLMKHPNQLTRKLNTLKPNLLTIGLKLTEGKSNGVRHITIEKTAKYTDRTDHSDPNTDDSGGKDDGKGPSVESLFHSL